MSQDTSSPSTADLVRAFLAAKDAYYCASRDMAKAEQCLKEAICFHDEMDDIAIPDGAGHFWIIRVYSGNSLHIQHTASMKIEKPEPWED